MVESKCALYVTACLTLFRSSARPIFGQEPLICQFDLFTCILDPVYSTSNITLAECNFNTDFCGYDNPLFEYGKFLKHRYQWSRVQGDMSIALSVLLSASRPLGDHTTGKGECYSGKHMSFLFYLNQFFWMGLQLNFYIYDSSLYTLKQICRYLTYFTKSKFISNEETRT